MFPLDISASEMTFRLAQKSKPLPNDQTIILNHIKTCEWDQIKVWIKHYNIIAGIRYSMHYLLSDLNNYMSDPQTSDMRKIQ